jgi:ribosome-binding protein aMBF1 (putative translation factor)
MKKYETIDAFFLNRGPEDIQRFVNKNLDISQQVYALLEEKGWTQKEFAKRLKKKEAEISKWLSGNHNLTLRSIAKMEAVLEGDIILTPQKAS